MNAFVLKQNTSTLSHFGINLFPKKFKVIYMRGDTEAHESGLKYFKVVGFFSLSKVMST